MQLLCSCNLKSLSNYFSKWMPSKDNEGRVYYYQANGEASAWELPEVNYHGIDPGFHYSVVQSDGDELWSYNRQQ